jgi:hypothetical protein
MQPNFRKACVSGIAEVQSPGSSGPENSSRQSQPSTLDLKKARRLATKKRVSTAASCSECRRGKRKCGELRPCERCIALGREKRCYSPENVPSLAVERPIVYSISLLDFRSDSPFPDGHLRHKWSSSIIRSFWSIGYKYSSFVDIFNNVPPAMSSSIANMLSTVAHNLQSRANPTGYCPTTRTSPTHIKQVNDPAPC